MRFDTFVHPYTHSYIMVNFGQINTVYSKRKKLEYILYSGITKTNNYIDIILSVANKCRFMIIW